MNTRRIGQLRDSGAMEVLQASYGVRGVGECSLTGPCSFPRQMMVGCILLFLSASFDLVSSHLGCFWWFCQTVKCNHVM